MRTYEKVFIIAVVAVVLGLSAVVVVGLLPPPGWALWARGLLGAVVGLVVFAAALSQFTGYSLRDMRAGRQERANVTFLLARELQGNQERLEATTSDGRSVLVMEAWHLGRRSWGLEQPLARETWDRFRDHPVLLGLPTEMVDRLYRYYEGISVLNRRFKQLSENQKDSVARDFIEAVSPSRELGQELIRALQESDSDEVRRLKGLSAPPKPWWLDPGWWQVILEVLAIIVAISVATPLISPERADGGEVAPSVTPTSTQARATSTAEAGLTPARAWRPGIIQLDLAERDKQNPEVELTLENITLEGDGQFRIYLTISNLSQQLDSVEYLMENIQVKDDAGNVYEPSRGSSSYQLQHVLLFRGERVTGHVDFFDLLPEARELIFYFPPFPAQALPGIADDTLTVVPPAATQTAKPMASTTATPILPRPKPTASAN